MAESNISFAERIRNEGGPVEAAAMATGVALKIFEPSVLSANFKDIFKYAPAAGGAEVLTTVAETGMLIAAAATQDIRFLEGAIAGKVGTMFMEFAGRKRIFYKNKQYDFGLVNERTAVKGPAYLAALMAKVFLPGSISAGKLDSDVAKNIISLTKTLDAAALVAGSVLHSPEAALTIYTGERLLSLSTEEADHFVTRWKAEKTSERMSALVKNKSRTALKYLREGMQANNNIDRSLEPVIIGDATVKQNDEAETEPPLTYKAAVLINTHGPAVIEGVKKVWNFAADTAGWLKDKLPGKKDKGGGDSA